MKLFLLVIALVSFVAPIRGAETTASGQLNFFVILADDLGAKDLGCYGDKKGRTPNLDKLAQSGTMFKTCYSTPLCSPSRVELMTGRYAFRTGWYNLIDRAYAPAKDSPQYDIGKTQTTFADVLKAKGYATAMAGKWQLSGEHPTLITDCGFDEYCMWAYTHNLPEGTVYTGGYQNDNPRGGKGTPSRYWHPSIVSNGKYIPTKPTDYGPDIHLDFLLKFAAKNKTTPYVAYYPVTLTHSPWDATPDPANPGAKTEPGFDNNLRYLDHQIGKIVKALEESGQRERTVIMFFGDNGTQGSGKSEVTELGSRVAGIISCPGLIKAGVVSDELIDLSDVLPTLTELSGASMPKDHVIDGKSFAHTLQGKPGKNRDWIFSYLQDKRMLRDKRWLLEGDGKFFDCGNSRDGTGYADVTQSSSTEVLAARKRFDQILAQLPAPPTDAAKTPQSEARKTKKERKQQQKRKDG